LEARVKAKTKTAARVRKQLRRHVKLTFVPHSANQYRPHLIRAHGLAVVVALVVILQIGHGLFGGGNVLGASQPIAASDLLADTNTERAKNNLPPLSLDPQLSKAALLKAQDMFKQQYWAHTAPDGTTPWHWFGVVGYDYDYAGENLARNFGSAAAVMAAWMASPEHKANILSSHYTQLGLAVMDGTYNGQPETLVVALYGKPVASAPAGLATTSTVTPTVAPKEHAISLWTRTVMAAESFTPAALLGLIILTIASIVAATTHLYRERLPKKLRQTHYRHHGAYKAAGLVSLAVVIISLYGGGQI
jgi:hypothetical protein